MLRRYLVTTADERTWPKDQPVLFLGEWCRLYNRKVVWEKLDAEVLPYHWDDRNKLYRDYQYLRRLYEELLRELANKLNEINRVDHSLRYWRILLGPWLGYFVQMLFDRWVMIERAVVQYEIAGVRVLKTSVEQVVPNDMDHFNSLYVGDLWNEAIYGQLLRQFTDVSIEEIPFNNEAHFDSFSSSAANTKQRPFRKQFRRGLARTASWFLGHLVRKNEAFFITSYLPIWQDLRLQWKLGQVPKRWRTFPPPHIDFKQMKRVWTFDHTTEQSFENIARSMIFKHIPTLYLEGYEKLQESLADLPWPKNPRLIFTSNSYSSNDTFKAWAAGKVENGAALVIGQHGGGYGAMLWDFTEDHQVAISNAWISWGWDDANNPKVKPVGNLKTIHHTQSWDPRGQVLLVEMTMPRYSYHMYSVPVASQWLDYFEDQSRFTAGLPDEVRRLLLVRLFSQDYGWCQINRWQDRFPDVQLDDGSVSMASLIKKSRLYISTYNATTFLESLSQNVPTIMFWNPNHWELRDEAIPYFNHLKHVGIFHETPESAAAKVAKVWDDVAAWWYSAPVQAVREEFCYGYSRMPEQLLKDLEQVLRQISEAAIDGITPASKSISCHRGNQINPV